MAGTDMTTRILKMYEALSKGKEIQKIPFCEEHNISERTFDRDIEKIRLFLSEEYSGKEVRYSFDRGSYCIPDSGEQGELSILELLVIVKILKSEQALEKREFEGFLRSLLSVAERGKWEIILKLLHEESIQYEGNSGQKAFLKLFGDLQKCIMDRNIIRLNIKGNREEQKRLIFSPVAVEYLSSDFYLLGYEAERSKGLTAFVLDEIESFQMTLQKYEETLIKQYSFQEGRSLLKNMQGKERQG